MSNLRKIIETTEEYKIAKEFLSLEFSKRHNISYFVHIDQGLKIIEEFFHHNHRNPALCGKLPYGSVLDASRAFCLHPLIQAPEDLYANYDILSCCSPKVVALTMEYCRIANLGSRTNWYYNPGCMTTSVLPEVNVVLIADKVQNRFSVETTFDKNKDMVTYTLLIMYFKEWLRVLNISEEQYQELIGCLNEVH